MEIAFENFPFTLRDEIENRQCSQNKYFVETELWYLLAMITNVCEKFHVVGKKVGDIRPLNVFINDNGEIKVVTPYSWPNELSNYDKVYKDREVTFLSPEESRELGLNRDKPISNVGTAETFSVGLTLLDAAMLDDCERLYDTDCKLMEEDLFNIREEFKLKRNYSREFKYVLLALTEFLPEKRLSMIELKALLEPYQGEIMELEPFTFLDFPQKLKVLMQDCPLQATTNNGKNPPENKGEDITFTFGRNEVKANKEQEKTQETTTLMRSRSSNFMKTPSPYDYFADKPSPKIPVIEHRM